MAWISFNLTQWFSSPDAHSNFFPFWKWTLLLYLLLLKVEIHGVNLRKQNEDKRKGIGSWLIWFRVFQSCLLSPWDIFENLLFSLRTVQCPFRSLWSGATDALWDGWVLNEMGKVAGWVAVLTGNAEVRGTISAILWLHLTSWRPCWWKEQWRKLTRLFKTWVTFSNVLASTWSSYHLSAIKEYFTIEKL